MDPGLIVLGGGAAALLYQWHRTHGPAPLPPSPGPHPPLGGGAPAAPWKQANTAYGKGGSLTQIGGFKQPARVAGSNGSPNPLQGAAANGDNQGVLAAKQGLRELEDQGKKFFADLTDVEKARGADALNHTLHPSPGLTGQEDWDEACAKVGASVGGAVGAAACSAIPIPGLNAIAAATVCTTLGAVIGAYLGDKLGDWAKKKYEEIKAWASKEWDKAKDFITDEASDAWDEVSGWF